MSSISEKAASKQQQQLMGIVHALQKGDMKPSKASGKAKQMAKTMKKGDVKDFASTKHKGLPKKVKKENMGVASMYTVQNPTEGMTVEKMVCEFNPLMGIQEKGIGMHQVHSVHDNHEEAQRIAAEVYDKYCNEVQALEEKKGKVGDKLKKTIDHLEKKRKEHIDMAKEDPKNASQHKEHIAKLASQIDDLMSKMEKIEKSKKNVEKKEDKKEDLKEDISSLSEDRTDDELDQALLTFLKNIYAKSPTDYIAQKIKDQEAEMAKKKANEENLYEGKNWSKMMAGVKKGSQSGPWTIVVSRNKKVVYQKQVKVKDAIPANFEDLKNTSGLNGDIFAIEDNEGMVVYYEKIQK